MSSHTNKRILKEKRYYHKNPLDDEGIYLYYDDNDMMKARALIIGPTDTPYEGGYYLFDFTFSNTYPFKPPKCLFYTTKGTSRMNPNLYTNGKVCLSLLGTWSGPGWTPANTLISICMSIRGLVLNDKPIQNEPSYKNASDIYIKQYNRILVHENLSIAVLNIMNNIPIGFECFKDIMIEKFKENYEQFMKTIQANKHLNGINETSPIWNSMSVIYNYDLIEKLFIQLAKKLQMDVTHPQLFMLTGLVSNKTKVKTKYQRQAPNGKAKDFELGFTKISENNNTKYIIALNKNGNHYWKIVNK